MKEKFDKKKEEVEKTPSSPLKASNKIQDDENSLDSPIKTSKKKTSARLRLESSSDEENGSPKRGNYMQNMYLQLF